VPELAPGVELGGYRLEQELGRGGMGIVYTATQKSLGRKVAIKVLPRKLAGDPEFVGRFEREALALASLNHSNIVHVIDKGVSGEVCFLVMELVEGVSLRRLLDGGKLRPEQALAIVPQICSALEYAHGKGIVHRDIKPENILVSADGQVKITDFGLARILHGDAAPGAVRLTRTNVLMGTPDYMAPEQRERAGSVDHRADIFSLGVVFYEMLTGELPLGRFPPPSRKVHVDVRLDEVVLKALEKEPGLRYQRASHMSRDVSQFGGPAAVAEVSPAAPGEFVQAGPRGVQIRLPGAAAPGSDGGSRSAGTVPGPVQPGPRVCPAAAISLGCGLVALLGTAVLGLPGIVFAVGAIVTGVIARRLIRESDSGLTGRGLATAGIVLGVIDCVIAAAGFGIFALTFGGMAFGGHGDALPAVAIGGGGLLLGLVVLIALAIVVFGRRHPAASRLSGLAVAALLLALAPFLLGAVLLVGALLWESGGRASGKYPVRVHIGQTSDRQHSEVSVDESRLRPDVAALIRSAEQCSFDSAKKDVLLPLAKRTDLNAEEQKLLAQTVMSEMDFDSGRVEVLKALIANPAFCPEASAAVTALSADFDFDSERDEILKLLARKGFPVMTEAPLPAEAPLPDTDRPEPGDVEEEDVQ
jgi:predicted Ser/Thr protein kinase